MWATARGPAATLRTADAEWQVLRAVLKQDMAWFDKDDNNSGSVMTRLGDDASAVRGEPYHGGQHAWHAETGLLQCC